MTNTPPDEELMSQVRQGEAEMLGVLFQRYQVPLFNFYCKLTGDRAASEDLVQEVFYRILKYRNTYRTGAAFRTWMYGIARHARVDRMRKQRPETELEPEVMVSPSAPPAARLQQEQETALLHNALLRLPPEKREILVLSRFQELKYEEIAQLLGLEVGTVKSRVCRALQELRRIVQELEQQPRGRTNVLRMES